MAKSAEKHPPGLYVLFATEMWERFSFYAMLALFILYLTDSNGGFGWSKKDATEVHATYMAAVYFSPLIGGWLADRYLGYRRSVMIGGVFFMAGHLLLAIQSEYVMYSALACLVVGNGFFKPNVSAMVGKMYPEESTLKSSAYSIFYMGINFGAFLGPVVMEAVHSKFGYHVAFAVAGGGMLISISLLWMFKRHVEQADLTRLERNAGGNANKPAAKSNLEIDKVSDGKRIAALLVIFGIVIAFWMAFHQNSSTWNYWAKENTDWQQSAVVPIFVNILTLGIVSGENISGIISSSINGLFVILFTFPVIWFWALLRKFNLEPSTPAKMCIGMLLVAAAYLVMYQGAVNGGDTGKVSPWYLINGYAVITLGELMISPMGLTLVSKVAPDRMRGLMMGGWFAATATGNKLVGTIGVMWTEWSHSKFFLVIACICAAVAALLFVLIKPLKKAMPGA
ncbi:MAG: peptide MFS transporter [Planctomycetota bacterium]